jgi:hypothetical protein
MDDEPSQICPIMTQAVIATAVSLYFLLILIGASDLTGMLLSWAVFTGDLPREYSFPLGFGVFPVLIAYGGFFGLWRLPGLGPVLAAGCAIVGGVVATRVLMTLDWRSHLKTYWWIYAIPLCALLLLAVVKTGYLFGGTSDGDEAGRSIMLTSAFASNALKPAFPLDFSMPIVYPYYLFETAAFLYFGIQGYLLPSIALLVITLFAIGLSYYVLFLSCELVFRKDQKKKFVLAAAFLTFSSLHWFNEKLAFAPFVAWQVQPISEYFHSGYHYLYGVLAGLLGIAFLSEYMRGKEKRFWLLALICFCLSFGYSGISFAWIAFGVGALLLNFVIEKRFMAVREFLPVLPMTCAVALFLVLPQFSNFLPRFNPTFSFSWPHLWFLRDAERVVASYHGSFPLFTMLWVGLAIPLVNTGVFVMAGFGMAFLAVTDWFLRRADEEWQRLLPVSTMLVMSALLLTMTSSITGDWFSRGFLVPTVFSCMIAAQLFHPLFFEKRNAWAAVVLVILIVQAFSVFKEHTGKIADVAGDFAVQINQHYPLGTVFYQSQFDESAEHIQLAGRAVTTTPPPGYAAYLNHPDVLQKVFGVTVGFGPCGRSVYGVSMPLGWYIQRKNGQLETDYCN